MTLSELAKEFFSAIEARIGPFDRPFQFRPFPFDAGGCLNFLTVGKNRDEFVTYVSWDLFGHPEQKRGGLGRYELLCICNDEQWCLDILTKIGRQGLLSTFEPGDTIGISPWVQVDATLRGIIFEEGLRLTLESGFKSVKCSPKIGPVA